MATFGPLVSTAWLADRLAANKVSVIDGSWRMPGGSPARDDYEKRHIPGAVFFDIDAIADPETSLPHMLPSPAQFSRDVGALGVSDADAVVVYDDQGIFSAARVWWTFRAMGHGEVAVLDGGLPKWIAEGRPVTDAAVVPSPATYQAKFRPALVRNADEVRDMLAAPDACVVDARSAERFCGRAPEPRPGLRSGAMPGAVNLPHAALYNNDGAMRDPQSLKRIFEDAGVDLEKSIVTSCGSGVTAAVLSLALERIGHSRHSLYDGSWAEWGDMRNDKRLFPVDGGG